MQLEEEAQDREQPLTLATLRDQVLMPRQQAFRDEPHFDEQIDFYVRAWRRLNTCRAIGFGVGAIPWTAIDAWCTRERLDDDARELVHGVLEYLDGKRAEAEQSKRDMDVLKSKRPRR